MKRDAARALGGGVGLADEVPLDEQIADNEGEYERGYAAWEAGQRALAS